MMKSKLSLARHVKEIKSGGLTVFLQKLRLVSRVPKERSPAFLFQNMQEKGFLPLKINDITKNSKILVFGFPRSGNVWFTNLIADSLGLTYDKQVKFTHRKCSEKHFYDTNLLRGVHLIRDIRDVIVSLYHFRGKGPGAVNCSWRHFDSIESFYFDFFTKSWANREIWEGGNLCKYSGDFAAHGLPVIHYEKLWDNTSDELSRLFAWWNIDVPQKAIEKSVEINQIAEFQAGNKVAGVRPREHFRRGGYGNYKSELPEIVLNDIKRKFGDYLLSWGYEI